MLQPERGQLKLSVYSNSGLLTVCVGQARNLQSKWQEKCNAFVKVSLIPKDQQVSSRCVTMVVKNSNNPSFEEMFSFELSEGNLKKRVQVSVWHKEANRSASEFLGCTSFGIQNIVLNRRTLNGWYYLLTDSVGKRKHLQVPSTHGGGHSNYDPSHIPSINQGLSWMKQHVFVLTKDPDNCYGFEVTGFGPARVSYVAKGGIAESMGLELGDRVVRVNNSNVSRSGKDSVSRLIRSHQHQLVLEVHRPRRGSHADGDVSSFLQGCELPQQKRQSDNDSVESNARDDVIAAAEKSQQHSVKEGDDVAECLQVTHAQVHATMNINPDSSTTEARDTADQSSTQNNVSADVNGQAEPADGDNTGNDNGTPASDDATTQPPPTSQPSSSITGQNPVYEEIHEYQTTLRGQPSGVSDRMQLASAHVSASLPAFQHTSGHYSADTDDDSSLDSSELLANSSAGSNSTLEDTIEECDVDVDMSPLNPRRRISRFTDSSPAHGAMHVKSTAGRSTLNYLDLDLQRPLPVQEHLLQRHTDKHNYISQWRHDVMRSYPGEASTYAEPYEYDCARAVTDSNCVVAQSQLTRHQGRLNQMLEVPSKPPRNRARRDRAYESEDCRGMRMRGDLNERYVSAPVSAHAAAAGADAAVDHRAYESEGGRGMTWRNIRPQSALYDVPSHHTPQFPAPCCHQPMYSSQPAMHSYYDSEYMQMDGRHLPTHFGVHNPQAEPSLYHTHALNLEYGVAHGQFDSTKHRHSTRSSPVRQNTFKRHTMADPQQHYNQPDQQYAHGCNMPTAAEHASAQGCNMEPTSSAVYMSMDNLTLQPQHHHHQQQQRHHHQRHNQRNTMTSQHQLGPIPEVDESAVMKVPLINPALSRSERLRILEQRNGNAQTPPYTKTGNYDKKKAKSKADTKRKALFKHQSNAEEKEAPASQRQFQPIGEEETNYKSDRPLRPIGQEDCNAKENKPPKSSKKFFVFCGGSAHNKKKQTAKK